jgi:sodium-dependent dicarboxylate transporter 2/3/5
MMLATAVFLSLTTYLFVPGDTHPQAPAAAAVVALMAFLWMFEVLPIAVTSLLPLLLFPFLGILTVEKTAAFYGSSTIYLFLGGFMLAIALQASGAHRRIALHIISRIGTQPARLVLGFMVATGFLSMWINNTATVMVMLPIAMSVLEQAKSLGAKGKDFQHFSASVMLGIAYAADIGGMATLVGTAPNLVYRKMLTLNFPSAPEPGFLEWMMMGIPVSVTLLVACWLLLSYALLPVKEKLLEEGEETVKETLKQLGTWGRDEVVAVGLFALAAILWVTGGEIKLGDDFHFLGWRKAWGLEAVDDTVVAIGCALLLFLIPSKARKGEMMMTWHMTQDLPWGVLLLFGGGFALAGGFDASGLSTLIGDVFVQLSGTSPFVLVPVVCLVLIVLTEIASNTAVTNLTLPILAKASIAMGVDPRILMIPATLSATCGFMMPVATPTHAIVYGTGMVKMRQMIRAGLWLDIMSLILVPLIFLLTAKLAWGIDLGTIPDWAMKP